MAERRNQPPRTRGMNRTSPHAVGVTPGRRHEGDAARAVFAEKSEIGGGIAEAEHALALRVRPAHMNAAIDQPPRHDAEALRIEIAEVDDIKGHELNLTRCRAPRFLFA